MVIFNSYVTNYQKVVVINIPWMNVIISVFPSGIPYKKHQPLLLSLHIPFLIAYYPIQIPLYTCFPFSMIFSLQSLSYDHSYPIYHDLEGL